MIIRKENQAFFTNQCDITVSFITRSGQFTILDITKCFIHLKAILVLPLIDLNTMICICNFSLIFKSYTSKHSVRFYFLNDRNMPFQSKIGEYAIFDSNVLSCHFIDN